MTECTDYDPNYILHGCELGKGHPDGTPGLHRDRLGNEWTDLQPEEPGRCASRWGSGYPEQRCTHDIHGTELRHRDRSGNEWAMVTMASLTAGTRVRHLQWMETGTIRVLGGVTEIRWDTVFGDYEVSPEGPVFPSDLEIIGESP